MGDAGAVEDGEVGDARAMPHDGGRTDGSLDAGATDPETGLLSAPCEAPLPTGFCLVSDSGDYIGGGESYLAQGEGSVTWSSSSRSRVGINLEADDSNSWNADFSPPSGEELRVGLYEPAARYPFADPSAGLSVTGNGRGCNTIEGRFSISELGVEPTGIVRFAVTFEQHCEGGEPALRGVIHFGASGVPDPISSSQRTVPFRGKVTRVAYDPETHMVYGLDATNRRLVHISLESGEAAYMDVVQVPNALCIDSTRQKLFVVNKGSSIIGEHDLSSLKLEREILWSPEDWGASTTHFEIVCAPDTVYVIDGAWAPGLFTIEGLDDPMPTVTDRSDVVAGVGGLVVNGTHDDLYYWYQYGWGAGTLNTAVHRLATGDFAQRDVSTLTTSQGFHRDPLDTPILLDETRGLVFAKNAVFDAENLTKVVYTLPGAVDTFDGSSENAYAVHPGLGLLATRHFVYELSRYETVVSTLVSDADQMFFDRDGLLWFLESSEGQLTAQSVPTE